MNSKHVSWIIVLTLLTLLPAMVLAQTEEEPAAILFRGTEEKIIEISVMNDSELEQPVTVEFFGPKELLYKFLQVPETLEAGEEIVLRLKLTSNAYLTGNQYVSTLVIRVGEQEIRKQIKLVFKEKPIPEDENIPVDDVTPVEDTNAGSTGFVPLGNNGFDLALNMVLIVVGLALAVLLILKIREIRENKEGAVQK